MTADEAWSHLLAYAKREMPEQMFRMWLEPLRPLEFTGSKLVLGAPDQFAVDWLDSKHAASLSGYAPMVFGHPCEVIFRVDDRLKTRVQMDLFAKPAISTVAGVSTALSRPVARPQLSARYTFDQFVIGKSNELAAAAAMAVAEAPGRVYNPLFIYGSSGLGKTHLMQAVAHDVLLRRPETRIVYVGAEQFTNDYVGAIQTRATAEFRRRYRETDLLLVDDVHFLKGKEATQEEFFHTFNVLYEGGRQILMTSDRPPSEISGIESRLVTRFEWGLVTDVELPDLEHRIAILRKKSELDQLQRSIPDEVIRLLAESVRGSVRELEGAVIRLLAFASLKHREVSLALAQEALKDKLAEGDGGDLPPVLSVSRIQSVVAQVWHVTPEALQSKTRTKTLTVPRQAAMLLCRELLNLQLAEIGQAFGGRDHSTVIHSLERASELVASDSTFATRFDQAKELLEQGGNRPPQVRLPTHSTRNPLH